MTPCSFSMLQNEKSEKILNKYLNFEIKIHLLKQFFLP